MKSLFFHHITFSLNRIFSIPKVTANHAKKKERADPLIPISSSNDNQIHLREFATGFYRARSIKSL